MRTDEFQDRPAETAEWGSDESALRNLGLTASLNGLIDMAADLLECRNAFVYLPDFGFFPNAASEGTVQVGDALLTALADAVRSETSSVVLVDIGDDPTNRFMEPLLNGGKAQFLVAAAVRSSANEYMGLLCAFDQERRDKPVQQNTLSLFTQVGAQFSRLCELKNAFRHQQSRLDEYEAMLEANPQVPWTADPSGKITKFNSRWLELTGLSREEALGDGWAKAPHPDDFPAMAAAWQRSLESGCPYDVEHRIRLADGTYRWMRSRAVPFMSSDGGVVRWLGTTEDVHDRRLAQAALLERDERLRLAAEATGLGAWEWRISDGSLMWDNQTRLLFGLPRGSDVSFTRDFLDAIDHRDQAELLAAVKRACEAGSGGSFEAEYRLRNDKGESATRWLLSTARCFFDGDVPVRMLGTVREVTHLKLALEAGREREMQIRLAKEAAGVGVWEWDLGTGKFVLDAKSVEMHGLPEEHDGVMTPEDWASIVDAGDASRAKVAYERSLSTGELYDVIFRVPLSSGSRWVQGLARPLRNDAGQVTKLIGLNVDVTKIRQAELDFLRVSRLNEVGALASTFAHELNQPLAALTNFVAAIREFVKPRGDSEPQLIELADRAIAQTRRMAAIVRRIRNYTVTGEVVRENARLRDLMLDAWAYLSAERPLDTELALEFDDELILQVDSVQFAQVLLNILRNAVEALQGTPGALIRVEARPTAGDCRIDIIDNGPGLNEAIVAHLFEPFKTTKKSGTGLGLPISRSLVEMHGGTIEAANEAAGGARFTVTLPSAALTP